MKALAVAGQNTVPANGGMRFVTLFTTYSGNRITDQGTVTLIHVGNSEAIVDEIWRPIRTAFRRAIDWIWFRYYLRTHEPTSAKMPDNCDWRHETLERQNLLGFEVIGQQWQTPTPVGAHSRITSWMAPQLGCFPLLITTENRQPDRTFRWRVRVRTIAIDPGW